MLALFRHPRYQIFIINLKKITPFPTFLKSFVTLVMKLTLKKIRDYFQIRKEMDDKLRLERNSLKSALDATHASELDKAVEAAKKEVERDTKANEKVLKDENDRFQLQIQTVQREVNALNQKIIDAVNHAVKEGDKKVILYWNIQI